MRSVLVIRNGKDAVVQAQASGIARIGIIALRIPDIEISQGLVTAEIIFFPEHGFDLLFDPSIPRIFRIVVDLPGAVRLLLRRQMFRKIVCHLLHFALYLMEGSVDGIRVPFHAAFIGTAGSRAARPQGVVI